MRKSVVGSHAVARRQRARAAFLEWRGPVEEAARAQAIQGLPTILWKGHTLYTIRCQGKTGRGPHVVHVPEHLLWALIDFRAYRCPYHA